MRLDIECVQSSKPGQMLEYVFAVRQGGIRGSSSSVGVMVALDPIAEGGSCRWRLDLVPSHEAPVGWDDSRQMSAPEAIDVASELLLQEQRNFWEGRVYKVRLSTAFGFHYYLTSTGTFTTSTSCARAMTFHEASDQMGDHVCRKAILHHSADFIVRIEIVSASGNVEKSQRVDSGFDNTRFLSDLKKSLGVKNLNTRMSLRGFLGIDRKSNLQFIQHVDRPELDAQLVEIANKNCPIEYDQDIPAADVFADAALFGLDAATVQAAVSEQDCFGHLGVHMTDHFDRTSQVFGGINEKLDEWLSLQPHHASVDFSAFNYVCWHDDKRQVDKRFRGLLCYCIENQGQYAIGAKHGAKKVYLVPKAGDFFYLDDYTEHAAMPSCQASLDALSDPSKSMKMIALSIAQ